MTTSISSADYAAAITWLPQRLVQLANMGQTLSSSQRSINFDNVYQYDGDENTIGEGLSNLPFSECRQRFTSRRFPPRTELSSSTPEMHETEFNFHFSLLFSHALKQNTMMYGMSTTTAELRSYRQSHRRHHRQHKMLYRRAAIRKDVSTQRRYSELFFASRFTKPAARRSFAGSGESTHDANVHKQTFFCIMTSL